MEKRWLALDRVGRQELEAWKYINLQVPSFYKFPVNVHLVTTFNLLHTYTYSSHSAFLSKIVMPQPSIPRWMATRSTNSKTHPGMIDVSIEEEKMDVLLNTPPPRKKRPTYKNMRSAEEIEAGIQRVAAYERQSLQDELVNATPQPLVPPATPRNSAETHVSDEEDGGDIMDNASYKPPSESTLDVPITDWDLGSLPDPVEKTVDGANKKCAQRKRGVTSRDLEGSVTESDGEPTPFKKVMGEKGKRLEKVKNPAHMEKGKGRAPTVSEDSPTESDDNPPEAPARPMQSLEASAATVSDTECVPPIQTKSRPKPRPVGKSALLAANPPPMKPSKPTSKRSQSYNNTEKQELTQPTQSKSRSSKLKTKATKAKEALKDAQDAVKKAQEVQKRVREEVRRAKESTRELGMRGRIKALNDDIGVTVDSNRSNPLRFSQGWKASKVNTHQGEGKAISEPNRKTPKRQPDYHNIFDFGTDESLMLEDVEDIGDNEPAKAGGSGVRNIGKGLKGGEMEEQKQGYWKEGNAQRQVTATIYHRVL